MVELLLSNVSLLALALKYNECNIATHLAYEVWSDSAWLEDKAIAEYLMHEVDKLAFHHYMYGDLKDGIYYSVPEDVKNRWEAIAKYLYSHKDRVKFKNF